MSKNVNKQQCDLLLNKMLENRDIACGFTKQNRYQVSAFWKDVENLLNAAGPPTKTGFEWKKVWTDQKRYVRKKASENLLNSRATGGGPNKTVPLSSSEQAIYNLIGAKESVEGVKNSKVFGTTQNSTNTEDDIQILFDEIVTPVTSPLPMVHTSVKVDSPSLISTLGSPKKKKQKMSAAVAVEEELSNQKQLCVSVAEAVAELKESNKENIQCMKRVYRALEKANNLRTEELEEQRRHNKRIEELKKYKIERKLEISEKLLEIKELGMKAKID